MGAIRAMIRWLLILFLCSLSLGAWAINSANYVPNFKNIINFGADGSTTEIPPFRAEMRDGGAPSSNYVQAALPKNVVVSAGSFYTPVYSAATVIQAGSRFYVVACRGTQSVKLTANLQDYDPLTGNNTLIDTSTVTVSAGCGSGTQYTLSFSGASNVTVAAGHRLKVTLSAIQTTGNTTDYVRIHDASSKNNSVFTVVEGSGTAIGNCLSAGTYSSSWGVFRTLGSDGRPRVDFAPSDAITYQFASYPAFSALSSSTKNLFTAYRDAASALAQSTKVLSGSGTVYSFSKGTGTSYLSGYHQLLFRDPDGKPIVRGFVNITPEADSLKFYSDATYSVQTDTFRSGDRVYAILVSPSLIFSSVKSTTLYNFNNGSSAVTSNKTIGGTQIKFDFLLGSYLANGDWGTLSIVTYPSNTGGKTRTYYRNIRRLDVGCTYCSASAPFDVTLQSATQNSVTLAWTPLAGNSAYRIYRDGLLIKDNLSGGSFTDSSNLTQGTSYTYSVRGISGGCESVDSNPLNAQTTASPGAFNARDFSGTDNNIHTKVAGTLFDVAIVASDSTFKTWSSVNAELWDASDASGTYDADTNCISTYKKIAITPTYVQPSGGGPLKATFPGINAAYANVVVKANFTGPPAKSGCSVDHFAIRPASFKIMAVSDASWTTAGTTRSLLNVGNNHRAGRPFRVLVNALSSTGAIVTNYTGSPGLTVATLIAPSACPLDPDGTPICAAGALDPGDWVATSGVLESLNATYSEAGSFTMTVDDDAFSVVDANDGSSDAEKTITSTAVSVGSFVPDSYQLSSDVDGQPTLAATCSSGGFLGQVFNFSSMPAITAVPFSYDITSGALGTPINNLTGTLLRPVSKLTASASWLAPVPGLGNLDAKVKEDVANPGNYLVTVSGNVGFTRPAKPDATTPPFCLPGDSVCTASLRAMTLDVTVSDTYAEGVITGSLGASGGAISNTTISPSGPISYGQLRLFHTSGTGLQPVPAAPLKMAEIQTWDGSAFQSSSLSCSNLAAGQIAAVYSKISCADTRLSMPSGLSTLAFSRIGAPKNGWVDLTWNLATAVGQTCTSGAPSVASTANAQDWLGVFDPVKKDYSANPTARARFGVRGARRTVYIEVR